MADEDFLKIFKPFYYINSIFCVRKFRFNNSVFSKIKTIDIVFAIASSCARFATLYTTLCFFFTNVNEFFVIFMYIILYIQFLLNFIAVAYENLYKSKQNVLLMVTLRDIFKFHYNSEEMYKLQLVLFIPCLFYISAYLILVLMKLSIDPLWTWTRVIFIVSTIIFDFELLHVSFIAYFLALRTKQWVQAVTYKETPFDEETMADFVSVIQKINDALHLMRESFQITVLFHFITTFTQTLLYIQILLLWMESNSVTNRIVTSHSIGVTIWICKGLLMETLLCFRCETLYRHMESAQKVSISLWNRRDLRHKRRFVKCMYRISTMNFSKFTACGLFTVDAALLLRMASVVATYTFVLLQFAFL